MSQKSRNGKCRIETRSRGGFRARQSADICYPKLRKEIQRWPQNEPMINLFPLKFRQGHTKAVTAGVGERQLVEMWYANLQEIYADVRLYYFEITVCSK